MRGSFDLGQPYRVTDPGGKTFILVMDRRDQIPSTFALMATQAPRKVAVRLSGGCKGMDARDKGQMLEYFGSAFAGYEGMIWSGGTRQVTADGQIDPMVTDIPALVASRNEKCIALGSLPRTDALTLQGESQLVLDSYGTRPNPGCAALLVVQDGAEGKLGWDGDVDAAFGLMNNLRTFGGFKETGIVAWNGGQITRDEILRSAKLGWPTIVVRGSGRAADEIVTQWQAEDPALMNELPKNHKLAIVDRSAPQSLRRALIHFGFLAEDIGAHV